MLLTFDIDRRPVKLKLNWRSQTWQLVQDRTGIWRNQITSSRSGPFDRKSWGVLWIDDLGESKGPATRLIVWDAPRSDADARNVEGLARIHAPRNRSSSLQNRKIGWSSRTLKVPANGPLSGLRNYVVGELKSKLKPNKFVMPGQPEFLELTGNSKAPSVGTNCYALGTGLARLAGRYKGIRDNSPNMDKFVGQYSLSATSGLPKRAKNGSWTDADGRILPKPGDFFALLTEGLGNTPENRRKTNEYAHVSVLLAYQDHGTTWITADFGQGQNPGGLGTRRIRTWFPVSNSLSSPGSGYQPRVVAGWVNIDKHFG